MQAQPIEPVIPEGILRIPYCASDSLNPFYCESKDNSVLWTLAYTPLYYNDAAYQAQPMLADSCVQTDTTVQLTLRKGIMTPQGTALSVADVLYSFRLAKTSPAFSEQLAGITDIAIGSTSDVIVFTLAKPNINACSLLHFPIVQYGTADSADMLPVGSGAYYYEKVNDGIHMKYNPCYTNGNARTAEIILVDAPADAARTFALESEGIDCSMSDLSDGVTVRIAATSVIVPMTNLVFVGINHDSDHLNNALFRRALSVLIDRKSITEHAFCSFAEPTSLPVHPQWHLLDEQTNDSILSDAREGSALLTQYAYDVGLLNAGQATSEAEKNISYSLRLLCCDGNDFKTGTAQQLKDLLSRHNIHLLVETLPEEDYRKAIRTGDFDLYIGEVRLTADMNQDVFLQKGGALRYGLKNTVLTCADTWQQFCAGECSLEDFLIAFSAEQPFIPLCFRQSVFHATRALQNEVLCMPENCFYNISVWEK